MSQQYQHPSWGQPQQPGRGAPQRPPKKSNKAGIGCGVVALLLVVGGCNQLLGIGDDDSSETSSTCAMAPVADNIAPDRVIGGGGNGGGWGSSGGSGSDGSSGGSTSGGSTGGLDTDTPDYEPGMDLEDVTPDMQAEAEATHRDMRTVGTEFIWFDKRTNKPFPWEEKAYKKAKKAARAIEEAEEALGVTEEDC
jgi:hypothetical protein